MKESTGSQETSRFLSPYGGIGRTGTGACAGGGLHFAKGHGFIRAVRGRKPRWL